MSFLGGVFGGNTGGSAAAMQAALLQQAAAQQANQDLTNQYNTAKGEYGTNYYTPYTTSGTNANTMYSNALGLNGPSGNAAATSAYRASPGYQWQLGQGVQALDRSAAGSGMFGSGNAAMALDKYGQGLANQDYGNWLTNLSGLNNQGFQAAQGQTGRQGSLAGIDTGLGNAEAGVITNAADKAAAALTSGANADTAANAQGGANLFSALAGGANLGLKASGLGGYAAPTYNIGTSSDEEDKTDITPLGKDEDGTKMYAFRYKDDPKSYPKVVGPMAQDIEKDNPAAVKKIGGHKVVEARAMYKHALSSKSKKAA